MVTAATKASLTAREQQVLALQLQLDAHIESRWKQPQSSGANPASGPILSKLLPRLGFLR